MYSIHYSQFHEIFQGIFPKRQKILTWLNGICIQISLFYHFRQGKYSFDLRKRSNRTMGGQLPNELIFLYPIYRYFLI